MLKDRLEKLKTKNNDIHAWRIPDWEKDVLRELSYKSCEEMLSLRLYCFQRLTITHPDPTVPLPKELVNMLRIKKNWLAKDLRRISPNQIRYPFGSSEHTCRLWYEKWGPHDTTLTVIKGSQIGVNSADIVYRSRLFPIDKAVSRLSLRFPQHNFHLSYAVEYRGVSGEFSFRNGMVLSDKFETSVSLDRWLASGGSQDRYCDELSDPWKHFAISRPTEATLEWFNACGLEYDEQDALATIRNPVIRTTLLRSRAGRRLMSEGYRELTALALGVKVKVSTDFNLREVQIAAVEGCVHPACPWVVDGVRPDPNVALPWGESHAVMLHAVNKIRHEKTNYEQIYGNFVRIPYPEGVFLAKQKVSQAITDMFPKTKDANNEVMRGRRLHL